MTTIKELAPLKATLEKIAEAPFKAETPEALREELKELISDLKKKSEKNEDTKVKDPKDNKAKVKKAMAEGEKMKIMMLNIFLAKLEEKMES